MFLVVGLGNPGKIYQKTRHNIGFAVVDFILGYYGLNWNYQSKFDSYVTIGNISNISTVFCKPDTFMNLSGNAVSLLMSYYKMKSSHLIVVHDDIELTFGKIKCKFGGGAGGHNGLRSIDRKIGSNYHRVRIGIGKPVCDIISISDYVLNNFSEQELRYISEKYQFILQTIHSILSLGEKTPPGTTPFF